MLQQACLLAICLGLAHTAHAVSSLRLDHARAGVPRQVKQHRQLLEEDDAVCFEGCYSAPGDSLADPLPIFLQAVPSGEFMPLDTCWTAAREANATYFSIVDDRYCFGGDSMDGISGVWTQEMQCSVDCDPSSATQGPCGPGGKATFFSMGACGDGIPCAPDSPPSPATPPTPPPPSPPAGKVYECRDGRSLWGRFLPNTPNKLSPVATTEENTAECKGRCDSNPACQGYYYKTTGWCYQMEAVFAFGKEYHTAVVACRVPKA